MAEMMKIVDEQGRTATPLLTPYPSGEDKYGVADCLVKEFKLHYAFTAVIYGLRTLKVLAGQDGELSKELSVYMEEAVDGLIYLIETDLSIFDRDEYLYEEAVKLLKESAGHNIGLMVYGLELMQKSYLIEKIDPLVILSCQESYLREHMKTEKAD